MKLYLVCVYTSNPSVRVLRKQAFSTLTCALRSFFPLYYAFIYYTANVLLVDSTDCVSVTNPTVVQAWFPLNLTTYLTMRNTAKATYFYRCFKELIMHIS